MKISRVFLSVQYREAKANCSHHCHSMLLNCFWTHAIIVPAGASKKILILSGLFSFVLFFAWGLSGLCSRLPGFQSCVLSSGFACVRAHRCNVALRPNRLCLGLPLSCMPVDVPWCAFGARDIGKLLGAYAHVAHHVTVPHYYNTDGAPVMHSLLWGHPPSFRSSSVGIDNAWDDVTTLPLVFSNRGRPGRVPDVILQRTLRRYAAIFADIEPHDARLLQFWEYKHNESMPASNR